MWSATMQYLGYGAWLKHGWKVPLAARFRNTILESRYLVEGVQDMKYEGFYYSTCSYYNYTVNKQIHITN